MFSFYLWKSVLKDETTKLFALSILYSSVSRFLMEMIIFLCGDCAKIVGKQNF